MLTQTSVAPATQKWRNLAEFGLIISGLLFTLYQLREIYVEVYDVDFIQFEKAIKLLLQGGRLYSPEAGFFYPYPLWTSFLYLPVAGLEHQTAIRAWLVLNMCLLLPVIWLLQKFYLPRLKAVYLLPLYCVGLALCTLNLLDGFPNIVILGALALMLTMLKAQRPFQAGAWGVVAMVIKPHLTILLGPVFLAWPLLLTGHHHQQARRWWLGAIITGTGLLLVSCLIDLGWIPRFLNQLKVDNMTGGTHADGKEYLWITSTFPAWLNFISGLDGLALNLIYGLFVVGVAGLGIWRLLGWREVPALWVALAITLNLTLTPYARPYDYPLLVIPLFALLAVIIQPGQARRYSQAGFLGAGLALVFLMPVLNMDFRWYYFQPLIFTILLLSISPEKKLVAQETDRQV